MFEARILQGNLLKKLIEAIRELVNEGNIVCRPTGISLQAMDSSHVSLCAMAIQSDGFASYRCDKPLTLGINLVNLAKILKCAGNEDQVLLQCQDEGEILNLTFESKDADRISDFEMKLMEINCEDFGIPETEYSCTIRMPSAEFMRIIRDLSVLGDACTIAVSKAGVKFSVSGDLGTGNITLSNTSGNAEKEEEQVHIEMNEPVTSTFAMRYLQLFTRATPLGNVVNIALTAENPIVVEYGFEKMGQVRFYLAPKLDEES